jgi:hypothetical protein
MAKVDSTRIAAIKANFQAQDTVTETNLADLIDAFAEAAQEHEHVSTGGAGSGTGDAGPVQNLKSGLDASKPEAPAAGDIYVATDTGNVYFCYVAGFWAAKEVKFINRQIMPDTWPRDIPNLQHGQDADKPDTPIPGDVYVATDTGNIYFCHIAGFWAAKEVKFINRQMRPDGLPADPHASTHASDGTDSLSEQDVAMASARLVPAAGIADDDEGWVWCDNCKTGFHQLRWRNASHKTRLDPGAQHLNRGFLIAYP